jgi:hypothetical protein
MGGEGNGRGGEGEVAGNRGLRDRLHAAYY